MNRALVAVATSAFILTGCATAGRPPATTPAIAPATAARATTAAVVAATPSASPTSLASGRVEKGSFHSAALDRTMRFVVYLPPGYDANPTARYPTAYLLHGGSGDIMEWASYGAFDSADRLMGSRSIPPFIIVLPEGDQEYWVDHVVDRRTGANGERWGTYTAKEVVPAIDARYRTLPRQDARAVGGISMGGHGAMQLSLNFPGIWGAIGAHSPALRPEGDAPTYLGFGADFNARDPLALIAAKPDLARTYAWWIDDGDQDPWRAQSKTIQDDLTRLGIAHEWHPDSGGHELAYWHAHMDDYIRYYGRVLCRAPGNCPAR